MRRKNERNDFEVIVPLNEDTVSERTKILDISNVLNRLNNLERDYKSAYNNLVTWVYNEFKSCSHVDHIYEIPLMYALKYLPSDKFDTFLNMLKQCEDTVKFNKKYGIGMKEERPTVPIPDYISFSVSRYALIDVIEELYNSDAKEIIVTKEDDNLVVKYKPHWKA